MKFHSTIYHTFFIGFCIGVACANTNVFFETQIQDIFDHIIITQLESINKLQCLHKCRMMNGKCSDIVFKRSGVGHCLLLKPSDSKSITDDDVEGLIGRLGMSDKNSAQASLAHLPADEELQKRPIIFF